MNHKRRFMRLSVEKLFVDRVNYQRELNRGNLEQILSAGWNETLCNALEVNERSDGRFFVYDGAHRLEAAKTLGIRDVPCMVVSGLSIPQEAQAFLDCNRRRKAPDWIDFLHGMIGAGDESAIGILTIIERRGFRIGRGGEKNTISAGKALVKSYDTYGSRALDRALGILKAAWDGAPDSIFGANIIGLARVACVYDRHLDDERMATALSRTTIGELVRLAKSRGEKFSLTDQSMAVALVEVYNKRLSAARALPLSDLTRSATNSRTMQRRIARGDKPTPPNTKARANKPQSSYSQRSSGGGAYVYAAKGR